MRDLRDPQILGEWLLSEAQREKSTARSIYDSRIVARDHIPDYARDESMVKVTVREYREELEAAAAAGDKYAKSRLETL